MKTKILVATHKPYRFPDDDLYVPVHVGKEISQNDLGYLGDDTGENISKKNSSYSELTALYWAWKNDFFKRYDYVGLVHYRRYFLGTGTFGKCNILTAKEIEAVMERYDVIVPAKRNYYIETVRSHYEHAHHKKDLDMLEEVLGQYSPEYMDAFAKVMKQRNLFLYNMFVMRTEHFDAYCSWLFMILFEVERRVDISGYDAYQGRVFGFLAERLFNVWLLQHDLRIKEVKVVNTEGENLILKAVNMLKRKYMK